MSDTLQDLRQRQEIARLKAELDAARGAYIKVLEAQPEPCPGPLVCKLCADAWHKWRDETLATARREALLEAADLAWNNEPDGRISSLIRNLIDHPGTTKEGEVTEPWPKGIREPTSDECSRNAPIGDGFACWYPQMGGYCSHAVLIPEDSGCFDVRVWHDGEFPFAANEHSPTELHHCDPEQFISFGDLAKRLIADKYPGTGPEE